jgi:hypothetical protein
MTPSDDSDFEKLIWLLCCRWRSRDRSVCVWGDKGGGRKPVRMLLKDSGQEMMVA